MKKASRVLEFEYAAVLRDQIIRLRTEKIENLYCKARENISCCAERR